MLRKFLVFILFFFGCFCSCFANDLKLRDYTEYQIPTGYNIPIMNLQEFSTAYTEEGENLQFVTTNDIYLYNKNVIPQGTRITGYIEKKNEPVVGTNASMIVFLNKMYFSDGFVIPIKAYIYTTNKNIIGGELTAPKVYNKVMHYQRWSMFRCMGVAQLCPGAERKMGEHVIVSAGANLMLVTAAPINMSHIMLNN